MAEPMDLSDAALDTRAKDLLTPCIHGEAHRSVALDYRDIRDAATAAERQRCEDLVMDFYDVAVDPWAARLLAALRGGDHE